MGKQWRFVSMVCELSLAVTISSLVWSADVVPTAFAQSPDGAPPELAESPDEASTPLDESPDSDEASAEPAQSLDSDKAAVRLNFEGADIREVIHTIAATLGIHYIIDPRVQGQVTIRTASDIPRDELLPMFHQILRSSGVSANLVGDIYHIVPVAEGKTKAVVPQNRAAYQQLRAEDRFVIEVVKVEHVLAEEMAKILQPFISPGGDVLAYPRANLVVISDLASNVRRLRHMVGVFDTDTFRDLHARVYRIEHANAEDLGEELSSVLEPYGVIATDIAAKHGVFVVPLDRLNAVVVIAFNTEIFTQVEKWLQILDVPPEKGGGRTVHVYAVENAKAGDLAGILGDLYGGNGGGGRGGSRRDRSGNRDAGSLGSLGGDGDGRSGSESGRGSSRSGDSGGRGGGFGSGGRGSRGRGGGGTQSVLLAPQEGEKPVFKEDVRIVADEITNSLIILATPRDYAMIRDVLRRLDIVPRQVLIEAIIAEIKLTDDLAFGLEYALSQGGIGSLLGTGTTGGVSAGETPGTGSLSIGNSALLGTAKRAVNIGSQGIFGFLTNRDEFLVLINALATENRVNILSTPHVIAADNREANILIGEEVPILTSTSTSSLTDTARTVNSIQYRETGKILTILPQINSTGLVNLEIRQEVSAVGSEEFGRTNSPSFISREAETTVVVEDGESVVLGGIIDDQIERSRRGVPYLMDIPVLGRLFRVDSEKVTRTELIILITPHVIRNRQELRTVSEEFTGRIQSLKEMIDSRILRQPAPPPSSAGSPPAPQ